MLIKRKPRQWEWDLSPGMGSKLRGRSGRGHPLRDPKPEVLKPLSPHQCPPFHLLFKNPDSSSKLLLLPPPQRLCGSCRGGVSAASECPPSSSSGFTGQITLKESCVLLVFPKGDLALQDPCSGQKAAEAVTQTSPSPSRVPRGSTPPTGSTAVGSGAPLPLDPPLCSSALLCLLSTLSLGHVPVVSAHPQLLPTSCSLHTVGSG